MAQLDGLVAGHQHAAAARPAAARPALTRLDFLFVNALVDLSSLIHKPFSADADWTAERAARHLKLTTHCSAVVRLSADGAHLWASHNTWSGYFTMLRVAKLYRLPALVPAGGGAAAAHFSGYFGTLSSQDDFFVLSSGLLVQETTNALFNASMAAEIVPGATLTWVRTIVANRAATDGATWADIFARNNSGTILGRASAMLLIRF